MYFFRIFKNIPNSVFPQCQCVCTHTRQVENQRCSRTGRVQKNHKILRKFLMNTLYVKWRHPVLIHIYCASFMHFIFYQTIFLYEILTLWNNANKYITVANMPNIAKLNGCFQIIKPPLLCCQILGFIFTRYGSIVIIC